MRFRLLLAVLMIQCSMGFTQTLEYLNFMEKPIFDTSKYKVEYLTVTSKENRVFHEQLFNRDTVKIRHTTILLDGDGKQLSGRAIGYYQDGKVEFSRRFDTEKSILTEKYFYPDGTLKSEVVTQSDEIISEIYYDVAGNPTSKPIIEDPEPGGGKEGWTQYLIDELRYPHDARSRKEEGTVLLEFDLSKQGEILEIRVGNPEVVHKSLWVEAIRVVESYPERWTPKKINGKAVQSVVRLPIRFKLG